VKSLLAIALVAAVAGVARADASKQAQNVPGRVEASSVKLPASARVFVLDKEAPPTEKTAQLPRTPPALKQKL
jgi:hypothetical protein